MTYSRFEDLPVWKDATALAARVFLLVDAPAFRSRGDLKNQLERAATSVANNTAEGFERGTTQELLTFLYIARGSAGEVRSMLHLLDQLPWFSTLKSEISDLRLKSEGVSRQIRGWADSLQNTDIKGTRYLTAASREAQQRKSSAAAFDARLRAIVAQAAREREAAAGRGEGE